MSNISYFKDKPVNINKANRTVSDKSINAKARHFLQWFSRTPSSNVSLVMPAIVVDEGGWGVVVFGGEAEGIFGDKVAVGDAGGGGRANDCAEGCVVIMCGDAVLRGVVKDLGNVLVAVVSVEEVEAPVLGMHDERARGNGFRGIPHKLGADGVAVVGIQPLDAEVVVVNKAEVRGDLTVSCLLIVHAATKAVESHGNHGVALFQ